VVLVWPVAVFSPSTQWQSLSPLHAFKAVLLWPVVPRDPFQQCSHNLLFVRPLVVGVGCWFVEPLCDHNVWVLCMLVVLVWPVALFNPFQHCSHHLLSAPALAPGEFLVWVRCVMT